MSNKNKLEFRDVSNMNLKVNYKRIYEKVIENMEVQYVLSKFLKEIIKSAVETTLWEIFERKEDILKDITEHTNDKDLNFYFYEEFDVKTPK